MAPAETSQSSSPEAATGRPHAPHPAGAALVVGALGVVFGDIGTSPLYALRETFLHGSGMAPTPEHVLGVLSMLFWTSFAPFATTRTTRSTDEHLDVG